MVSSPREIDGSWNLFVSYSFETTTARRVKQMRPHYSGESCSSWGTGGLSRSTSPVGQPGPEGFFSQPRIGRTMFSAAIGVPL